MHICERQNLPKVSNLDIHNMKPIKHKQRLERERERERERETVRRGRYWRALRERVIVKIEKRQRECE